MPEVPYPRPVVSPTTQPYWDAAAQGRLELMRCGSCDAWVHYPRSVCPSCWSRELSWVQVSGAGEIYSFTRVEHLRGAIPSYEDRVPYTVALVQLDEGPRLIANLIGDAEPRIGQRVVVTFEDRDGHVLPQFTPVAEPG